MSKPTGTTKPNLYDAQHPDRQKAISIIKQAIEPLLKKGINGQKYYALEDQLTLIINQGRLELILETCKEICHIWDLPTSDYQSLRRYFTKENT